MLRDAPGLVRERPGTSKAFLNKKQVLVSCVQETKMNIFLRPGRHVGQCKSGKGNPEILYNQLEIRGRGGPVLSSLPEVEPAELGAPQRRHLHAQPHTNV